MSNDDKAKHYLELAKLQMDHLRQTREIEFKVNLALWTAIVLAGAFLTRYVEVEFTTWRYWYVLVALLIIGGHMFLWMMPVQHSQDRDNDFITAYRQEVETLLLGEKKLTLPKDKRRPRWLWKGIGKLRLSGWSWVLSEVGMTFLLLATVGLLLLLKSSENASTATGNSLQHIATSRVLHKLVSISSALIGTFMLAFGLKVKSGISKSLRKELGNKQDLIAPSDVRQRTILIALGLALITIAAGIQLWLVLL